MLKAAIVQNNSRCPYFRAASFQVEHRPVLFILRGGNTVEVEPGWDLLAGLALAVPGNLMLSSDRLAIQQHPDDPAFQVVGGIGTDRVVVIASRQLRLSDKNP